MGKFYVCLNMDYYRKMIPRTLPFFRLFVDFGYLNFRQIRLDLQLLKTAEEIFERDYESPLLLLEAVQDITS